MIRTFRDLVSLAAAGVFFAAGLGGCTSEASDDETEIGSLALPLAAEAPSGARYRLRDATFQIRSYDYYDDWGGGGSAGEGVTPTVLTINAEDQDPDAGSIIVDLKQGSYSVTLLPGWRFEKVQGTTVTDVEATLLSSNRISVYVSPRSTTWAQYRFGIGDSDVWLNGKLNINIRVYEDPDEYYGAGGSSGEGGWSGGGGDGSWGQGGSGGWITAGAGGSGE